MDVKELRLLVFPRSNGNDPVRFEHGNICSISEDQVDQINELFLGKYGHRQNGYNGAHHYFLQGIVHYSKMDFNDWESGLSDECILDVYAIAPELFDPERVQEYYVKSGTLSFEELL